MVTDTVYSEMCSLYLTRPWGAAGSHSAVPGDQLQILSLFFGLGCWLETELTYVFYGGGRWSTQRKPTQTRGNVQTPQRTALHQLGIKTRIFLLWFHSANHYATVHIHTFMYSQRVNLSLSRRFFQTWSRSSHLFPMTLFTCQGSKQVFRDLSVIADVTTCVKHFLMNNKWSYSLSVFSVLKFIFFCPSAGGVWFTGGAGGETEVGTTCFIFPPSVF